MKVNKINSENYESFYLDYLEGNLPEKDAIELRTFLKDYPDLQVDEDLFVLEQEEISLGQDFKNLLKTDVAGQTISLNNIEFFLVAQKEGQLSESKLNELTNFLTAHPEIKKDQKLYARTTLVADRSIVYGDKNALKQRATIVLWPYYSALAAACAVLFFWLMPNSSEGLDAASAAQDMEHRTIERTNVNVAEDAVTNENRGYEVQFTKETFVKNPAQIQKKQDQERPKEIENNVVDNKGSNHKNEKPTKLKVIEEQKLDNITIALNPNPNENNNDKTTVALFSGTTMAMKDVARPVTRKISDIIKSEVNLKKGVDVKGEREGIFFKVGQFEFYRNRKAKP